MGKVFALLELVGLLLVAIGVGMWLDPGAGVAVGGAGLVGVAGVAEYVRIRPSGDT